MKEKQKQIDLLKRVEELEKENELLRQQVSEENFPLDTSDAHTDTFQQIIDNLKFGTFYLNANFEIELVTDTVCKFVGIADKENLKKFFKPFTESLTEVIEVDRKSMFLKLGDKERLFQFLTTPIPNATNLAYQVIVEDVAHPFDVYKKLIDKQLRYKTFIERINEGIVVVDFDGIINFVNPKYCELVKKDKKDLIGKLAYDELNILNYTKEEMLLKARSRKGLASDVYELKMQLDDGSIKWAMVSAAPILNAKNEPVGSVGIHRDITFERKVERENKQLINVVNNSSDFVLITDGNADLNYANEAFKQYTGLNDSGVVRGKTLMSFLDNESAIKLREFAAQQLLKKNNWEGEVNIFNRHGELLPFSLMLWTQNNADGKFEFIAAIARDISEQKKQQREIAILARIPDENPFPVLRISKEGVLEYANKASTSIIRKWGTQQGDTMPKLWQRIVGKSLNENQHKEFEVTAGNRIFELLLVPIPEYGYVNVFGNDITTRKLSSIELKSSERRYRAVVEDQTEFISRFLPNGTITFANRAYCEYFGLERDKIIGKNLFANFQANKLEKFKKRLGKLSFENPVTTYDERLKLEDGSVRWQLWTDRAIFDENGKFIEYQSVGQDITKAKRAEEAISQQRKYLRDIIDANPNAIYVRDATGEVKMLNNAASKLFSKPLKDLIHTNPEDKKWAKTESMLQLLKSDVETIKTAKVKDIPELKFESRGKVKWYQTIKTPIKSPDGNESQVLSVSTEITDRKLAEEELKFQLDLKEMIATLSTQFISLNWTEIDSVLKESLEFVGDFTKVDRTIVTELTGDEIEITHFWSRNNAEKWNEIKEDYENVKLKDYQWLINTIEDNGYFILKDIKDVENEDQVYYELLSRGDVKSLLILPMYSKGKPVAFLSLVNTIEAKKWNQDTIALFRILTQVFSNARERRNSEYKLSARMNLENVITRTSSRFINVDSEFIQREIESAIHEVADSLKMDQAFVLLKEESGYSFNLSHYWSSDENLIHREYLRNIPARNHLWEFKQLRDNQFFYVKDPEDLPKEAADLKAIMCLIEMKSLMVIPISYEHKFYGALGFSSIKKIKEFNNDLLPLLNILGQVFANALERKKVEDSLVEQEEIYRTLAKNIPSSTVFLFDKDLNYILAEGSGLSDMGMSKEQVEGKKLYDILSGEIVDELEPYYISALKGKESTIEKKFLNNYFLMHFLPVKIKNNPINMGMLVSIDITNLKEIQQELEKQAEELKRSNEDLEQFAYAASHDLQEPLRMVSSYVHLIKRRLGDALNGEIHEFMDFAIDGAARMQDLINDLLEYSRVDRSGRDFEQVDLFELVQVLETMLTNKIKESRASLKYSKLPKVKGDKSQLYSLLQNLLENAIKFRGDAAPIVEIGYKEYKDKYNIWVKDNGIGIDERFFERIFVIFQRLNNRTSYSGTGIGLAICKKIVERHGGSIWVNSVSGKGSTFYFDLKK